MIRLKYADDGKKIYIPAGNLSSEMVFGESIDTRIYNLAHGRTVTLVLVQCNVFNLIRCYYITLTRW